MNGVKTEPHLSMVKVSFTRPLVLGFGAVVLLLALYAPVLVGLAEDWWNDPNYSHGFLVPLAAGYFAWRKKETLGSLAVRPSFWGLLLLVFSQAVFLVGFLGSEYFLQRFSFLLVLAGGILFLYGWAHLRVLAFPLALFLFMIPLPALVFNAIAAPLQLIASQWAEVFLRSCSVPIFREGNILILAHQSLNVTEACSGIRSLFSLATLALIVSYFLPVSTWLRGLFVLSVLPIALLTNSLRVAGTGLLSQWWGEKAAEGFFHGFSGWLVFLLAFALLCLESMVFERGYAWVRKGREAR